MLRSIRNSLPAVVDKRSEDFDCIWAPCIKPCAEMGKGGFFVSISIALAEKMPTEKVSEKVSSGLGTLEISLLMSGFQYSHRKNP